MWYHDVKSQKLLLQGRRQGKISTWAPQGTRISEDGSMRSARARFLAPRAEQRRELTDSAAVAPQQF
jgi:hypothetical protein